MMVLQATTSEEIDTALATFAEAQVSALLVDGDGLLFNRRAAQFAVLTARYRLPASYWPESPKLRGKSGRPS